VIQLVQQFLGPAFHLCLLVVAQAMRATCAMP